MEPTRVCFEDKFEQVVSLIPVYTDGHQRATEVHLTGGKVLLDRRRMRGVLEALAHDIPTASLSRLRSQARKILGRGRIVPLPYSRKLVLVPVRVRRPEFKDDGAYAYFNIHHFSRVEPWQADSYRSVITLDGGIQIKSMDRMRTVQMYVSDAHRLLNEYRPFRI
ncbi:MAG: hypothetical protein H5U03_02830 [Clostridia bacterium]|nr:hypothetical protein [Clostridia bacterium]